MQILQFKKCFFSELSNSYPETEIQSFFNILIEHVLNLNRIDIALQPNFEISENNLNTLQKNLNSLKNNIPIQYIIGETEFYGLPFKVNKNVLIPRPETEELVSWILEVSKVENSTLTILDIGTGSGCIPISLAKNLPTATISAIDISSKALKTAKENAQLNNVTIQFLEKDILKTNSLNTQYNIIVSNPPYVRELEKAEMQKNVLNYEPHLALFVENNNPLLFYNKIADLATKHLSKNGLLFFEINQYLGKETVDLLISKGFTAIELKKDMFGVDRMIKAVYTS
ncbi:peptide chain release factor N(5)-glutamine methyltransferase [Lutibacter holmesii]|uniref:Release factor glutamine methyltransferase n=1 Tax=Lutibacter holmesii TaxID=1137985 RepID=A0ABW3WS70_9FLAO